MKSESAVSGNRNLPETSAATVKDGGSPNPATKASVSIKYSFYTISTPTYPSNAPQLHKVLTSV